MANPEIDRMARRAVREVADSLRNRAHDLEVAFHGDNRRPCKKAATAMRRAAAMLDDCDATWEANADD